MSHGCSYLVLFSVLASSIPQFAFGEGQDQSVPNDRNQIRRQIHSNRIHQTGAKILSRVEIGHKLRETEQVIAHQQHKPLVIQLEDIVLPLEEGHQVPNHIDHDHRLVKYNENTKQR